MSSPCCPGRGGGPRGFDPSEADGPSGFVSFCLESVGPSKHPCVSNSTANAGVDLTKGTDLSAPWEGAGWNPWTTWSPRRRNYPAELPWSRRYMWKRDRNVWTIENSRVRRKIYAGWPTMMSGAMRSEAGHRQCAGALTAATAQMQRPDEIIRSGPIGLVLGRSRNGTELLEGAGS